MIYIMDASAMRYHPSRDEGTRPSAGATPPGEPRERLRRRGGGRKALVECDSELLCALESLVDPGTCGDPMSPLRWTCKSAAQPA